MIKLLRTNSENTDFIPLVKLLDADLAVRDGVEQFFYAQYNKIDAIKFVVIAYEDVKPLGCGALKQYGPDIMEIKRMYVTPDRRGEGIAVKILTELEAWAGELGFSKCILETGRKQPEAIRLYTKCGYSLIPNYSPYTGAENSLCFEKILISGFRIIDSD